MGLFILGMIIIIILLIIFGIWLDLYLGFKIQHPKLSLGLYKTSHNQLEMFQDGRHLFSALESDMKQAQHHIHLSFYIFREDTLGQRILDLLEKRGQDGVRVRILADALGSRKLSKGLIERLHAAGVELIHSAKPSFPFFFYYLNRRQHRKIAVIDGKLGYFGGFNIGDEYLGKSADHGEWRDYHVKIKGKGVHFLQEQFLNDWHEASKTTITDDDLFGETPTEKGPVKLTLLATNGKQLEQVFIDHISQAEHSLVLGSPYFIPSARLQAALINRLESGVQVTIILPGRKDHPFVKPASYRYLKPLVKKGLNLHHFYHGFYHGKTFLVDDQMAYLGTANLDRRSLFWNDELSGFIYDSAVVRQLKEHIADDIATRSSKVTLEMIENRSTGEKLKTFLSCLLSPYL